MAVNLRCLRLTITSARVLHRKPRCNAQDRRPPAMRDHWISLAASSPLFASRTLATSHVNKPDKTKMHVCVFACACRGFPVFGSCETVSCSVHDETSQKQVTFTDAPVFFLEKKNSVETTPHHADFKSIWSQITGTKGGQHHVQVSLTCPLPERPPTDRVQDSWPTEERSRKRGGPPTPRTVITSWIVKHGAVP